MPDKSVQRENKNINKKILSQLNESEKIALKKIVTKLSEKQFELLLETIFSSIDFENIVLKPRCLSNSELESELGILKSHLIESANRVKRISTNKDADARLDFFYWKANNKNDYLIKQSIKEKNDSLGILPKLNSGYAQIIEKMIKGLNLYQQHMRKDTKTISKGRNKNLNYHHLIIELNNLFMNNNFPYKVTGNAGSVFFRLVELIIKQNPHNLIKNTLENMAKFRKGI